jgi:hypothetical protein
MKVREPNLYHPTRELYQLKDNPACVDFTSDSGLRQVSYQVTGEMPQLQKHSIIYVIRQRNEGEKYQITLLGYDKGAVTQYLDVACDRYEIRLPPQGGHEVLVCYPRFGIPEMYDYRDIVIRPGIQQFQPRGAYTPGFYDDLEKQLTAEIQDPTKNETELYLASLYLSEIYQNEMVRVSHPMQAELMKKSGEVMGKARAYQNPFSLGKAPAKGLRLDPFYVERRVYQVKGKSRLKPYLVNRDGRLVVIPEIPKRAPQDKKEEGTNGFLKGDGPSFSGKYQIALHWNGGWLTVTDVSTGQKKDYPIPDSGFCANACGWHPQKDLFYFDIMQGPDDGRGWSLWQFDPEKERFAYVGFTSGQILLSPDRKWILWGTGGHFEGFAGMTVEGSHLNVSNIDAGINYELTPGASLNYFFGWK